MATFLNYDDYAEKVWWFVAYLQWADLICRYPSLKAATSDKLTNTIAKELERDFYAFKDDKKQKRMDL